jgi:hypothetical protein
MSNPRPTLIALAATGVAIAANSLMFGTQLFFDPSPFSEIGASGTHRAYNVVLLLCVASLSVVLPGLRNVVGRTGRSLPVAVIVVLGVGVFLDGGTRFVEAFVVPYLADLAPQLLDETPASGLMYAMMAAWILYMSSLIALGVTAYRRHVFPRPACVLLIVGGASLPVFGPLSGMLVGTAFAWSALAAKARLEQTGDLPAAAVAATR